MHKRRARAGGPDPAAGRFFGPGELRLALLTLVAERPGHGYDLMTRLEERFDGAYRASAGAVYPTLQQLEDEGLVRVEPAGGRKVHHVTAAGAAEARRRTDEADRIWTRAAARGEWGTLRDPDAAEILVPAMRLIKTAVAVIVRSHRDPVVVDEVRDILDDARRRLKELKHRR